MCIINSKKQSFSINNYVSHLFLTFRYCRHRSISKLIPDDLVSMSYRKVYINFITIIIGDEKNTKIEKNNIN